MNTTNLESLQKTVKELKETLATVETQISQLNNNTTQSNKPIIERVKSFEDACNITGKNIPETLFQLLTPQQIASIKLQIIAEALREGVKLDWFNTDQYKYYLWFKTQNNAFVFGRTYYDDYNSVVPSALCVDTFEKAEYFAKQFIDLWKVYLTE